MKKLLTINFLLVIGLLLLNMSCELHNREKQLHQQSNDSLLAENNLLKLKLDSMKNSSQANAAITKFGKNESEISDKNNQSEIYKRTYCFVLIRVTLKYLDTNYPDSYRRETKNAVSDINSFINLTDDDKYELMDKVQKLASQDYNYDSYLSRDCFCYDTYREASENREKFIVNHE